MVGEPKIVGIIPARGGSKGIPGKNIKNFCGKPLIIWTIGQMLEAGVTDVVVSTDSSDIGEVASSAGARVVSRPPKISGDHSTSEEAILHAIEVLNLTSDTIILFAQATSPLRQGSDFKEAVKLFTSSDFDSLFSACRIDDLTSWSEHQNKLVLDDPELVLRSSRQRRKKKFVENGSFYISTVSSILSSGTRLSGKIIAFEMPKYSIHEIDDPEDWKLCEILMREFLL